MVKAFETDGVVLKGEGDGVGGEKRVGKAEHGEDAEGRAGGQVEGCGDDAGAGAFRADQGAGYVEVVLGKQLVEVVAGDAARDVGESFADQRGVAVADPGQACVDLAFAAAGLDFLSELVRSSGADGERRAVVEDDVEGFDIVNHFAAQQAVDAATVVADHAAEGAAGVGGGVGRVGQVVEFGGVAEAVENDARLDNGDFGGGVNKGQAVHVAGVIEDHRDIGALSGQAGARAARQNGGAEWPSRLPGRLRRRRRLGGR